MKVRIEEGKVINLHAVQAVKRFRENTGMDENNDVEAITTRSVKKKRLDAETEVVELL